MKKIIIMTAIAIMACTSLAGCGNKAIIDTTYTFDKAVIYVGGEWLTVEVEAWTDYEDGDQIQIKSTDGNTYLVHSANCTLVHTATE